MKLNEKAALVVLSGGQDSTTCLYWAKRQFPSVTAITFDYGQRHQLEIEAAQKISQMANVPWTAVEVPRLLSDSPLVSDNPLEQYTSYQQMERVIGNRVELTFVPMRNAIFLCIAANHAVALGCANIVTGVCQADNANYPDCRAAFIRAAQKMLQEALDCKTLEIHTPLIFNTKAETVKLALELPGCYDALAYSHTSYDGKYPPVDKNHANVLRAQGFKEAGVADPLVLRAWREGLMALPDTENYDAYR